MANIKISELDELQKATDQDLLAIVDVANNKTKKIQAGNLGILVPKNTKTTSDTETYSCNYVNNEVDKLLPENAKTTGTTNTYSCDYINSLDEKILDIYSTSEQIVGKDENGKNVYKRTFSGTTSDTSNSTTITTDYSGKTIVVKSAYGSIYNPTFGGGVTVGGYVNENFYCGLYLHESELQLYYGNACKNFNYNITIEFTKVSE